jgi:hypothetical protein
VEAEVLSGNKAMMTVFNRSGLPTKTRHEGGTLHVSMAVGPQAD